MLKGPAQSGVFGMQRRAHQDQLGQAGQRWKRPLARLGRGRLAVWTGCSHQQWSGASVEAYRQCCYCSHCSQRSAEGCVQTPCSAALRQHAWRSAEAARCRVMACIACTPGYCNGYKLHDGELCPSSGASFKCICFACGGYHSKDTCTFMWPTRSTIDWNCSMCFMPWCASHPTRGVHLVMLQLGILAAAGKLVTC